jgi:hypothetical protein
MIINRPQRKNEALECWKGQLLLKGLSAVLVKSMAYFRKPAVERWASGNRVLVASL